ncbi:I78 family peptidase inhibitor [Pseudomonas matsuisoli]|uniref:Peptidase inhibitor I78 family protein n=1 Tax=Pseudomonas matsuisoli TaxID=1515666 RepID=A0A917PST6_9PSED|nr:I78 family peptidase inhibitor [Pseudomonas matsuisoli]GGJ90449.1 hypothetical protein GCM10009304_15190 [Pseudomonas matsuisoli]
MPVRSSALFVLSTALLLGACSSSDTSPSSASSAASAPSADGRCDSAAAQAFTGKQISDALIEQAQRTTGAGNTRVLRPGDSMTMDYDSTRLNLDINASGVVQRASCG